MAAASRFHRALTPHARVRLVVAVGSSGRSVSSLTTASGSNATTASRSAARSKASQPHGSAPNRQQIQLARRTRHPRDLVPGHNEQRHESNTDHPARPCYKDPHPADLPGVGGPAERGTRRQTCWPRPASRRAFRHGSSRPCPSTLHDRSSRSRTRSPDTASARRAAARRRACPGAPAPSQPRSRSPARPAPSARASTGQPFTSWAPVRLPRARRYFPGRVARGITELNDGGGKFVEGGNRAQKLSREGGPREAP